MLDTGYCSGYCSDYCLPFSGASIASNRPIPLVGKLVKPYEYRPARRRGHLGTIMLLAENDYPPVDRDEVYKEIFEQAQNFKVHRAA